MSSAKTLSKFTEFVDALAAQVLPSSPYADRETKKFDAWRAARGG